MKVSHNTVTLLRSFKRPFHLDFVFILWALCAFVVDLPAQEWKTVGDGVEYAEVTKEISGLKVNMNLLRLDLTKVRLDVHHAMDAAIGTEKTSSIAARHGAFAAINAGFFRLDRSIWAGTAAGIQKIDGRFLNNSSFGRAAILIRNRRTFTSVDFEHLTTLTKLVSGKRQLYALGLNRERQKNDLVIYTPEFHATSLTTCDGLEIVVRREIVTVLRDGSCSNEIPKDGYVVASSGDQRELIQKSGIRLGSRLRIAVEVVDPFRMTRDKDSASTRWGRAIFQRAEDITNGVPQLIKNGKIDITWKQEKASKSFVETRHPRTAVAKLKDGKFLMITVDGRSEASGGISLYDLADYILSLGAIDAMNLDGGGSTTMFLDGKVVNKPSDKEGERKVSDAILVTLRKKKS